MSCFDKEYGLAIMADDFREHIFAHTMRRRRLTPDEIIQEVISQVEEEFSALRDGLGVSDFTYNDVLIAMRRVLNDRSDDDTFDFCDARGEDQLCYDSFRDIEPYIAMLQYYLISKIEQERYLSHQNGLR